MMRTLLTALALIGAVGVLPAVAGEPADGAAPGTPAYDEGSVPPKPALGWTGMLGEKEFKALHELRKGEVPELHGETIELAGGYAYLSLPEGEPPLPGIVVIHEWWGLNDNIRHWTDRLAADGYAAIAVDLYDGKVATTSDEAYETMMAVNDERALEILRAAFAFLKDDPRVKADRRGSIGWCFGGGWSLRLALAEPDLDACVMYYGRLVEDPEELSRIGASLCGIFANLDESIPPAAVDAFDKALTTAGVHHEIHRYDANHAFANPSGARYDFEAAADAWEKVRVFLAKNLKE